MADVHVVEDNEENSSNGAEAGPSTSQILVEFFLCDTKGSDVHQELEASKFEVEAYMKNFRPTSVDTERLLSISRISENSFKVA